jgi:hypothetical protein
VQVLVEAVLILVVMDFRDHVEIKILLVSYRRADNFPATVEFMV